MYIYAYAMYTLAHMHISYILFVFSITLYFNGMVADEMD